MKVSLIAVTLIVVALTTACAAVSHHSAARTVSSTRLIGNGDLRVTAAAATPIRLGRPLVVTFTIRNVSKQPHAIQLGYPANLPLLVHAPDGTTYDTVRADELTGSVGGIVSPTTIRPGATVTRRQVLPRVHQSGPLTITPAVNNTELPPLRLAVATPGRTPSERTAFKEVVAATGHLLHHCLPAAPGVSVTGKIEAPEHSAPAMSARCSIGLRRERGFVVAQVLIAAPAQYRGAHLVTPYEQITWPRWGHNTEVIGWRFVVTDTGAVPVAATSMYSTRPGKPQPLANHGEAPQWQWTTSGPTRIGGLRCGSTTGSLEDRGGPVVTFVAVCPRR